MEAMFRWVRKFAAPVIGCSLILTLLVPIAARLRAKYVARHSPMLLCVAEVLKTHHIRMRQAVLFAVQQSSGGGTSVSFSLPDEVTGQDLDCHCKFDKSGNLTLLSVVAQP